MSRAEVIEHIGTIAKSGTREFLQALTGDQRKDATLIGQFGVGFYSAFIVADRVELTTRRAGLAADEAVRWTSDGRGQYTLEAAERPARGTTVVLHLRDDDRDLLSGYRLRAIIAKYSDHISLPILMPAETSAGEARSRAREPKPSTRPRRCGRDPRPRSATRTTPTSTGTSPATTPTRSAGCTARSRGPTSTRCCCSSRPAPRTTCGSWIPPAASGCTSGGSSSWRTPAS